MSLPQLPTLTAPFHEKVFKNKPSSPVSSTAIGSQSYVPPFEQLVLVGATVVQFGILNWLNDYNPSDSMNNLTDLGKLTNRKPSSWGKLYRLRSLCSASSVPYPQTGLLTPLPSPPASSTVPRSNGELFRAYVGALFLDNGGEKGGLSTTNRWIRKLLEHEVKQGTLDTAPEDDESSGMSVISPLPSPTASNVSRKSVLASGASGSSNGDTVNSNAISQLTELVMKAKKEIVWHHSSEGDDHSPIWTMEASIIGYEKKFKGVHQQKKLAKNMAAKLAMEDQRLISFLRAQTT